MSTEANNEEVIEEVINTENLGGEGSSNPEEVVIPAEVVTPELNDDLVTNYLKTRSGGKEFGSIDDLFVEKTVEVNPYKDILEDAEARSFLDFKKETGRGLQDYLKLQENINDIPVKNLAIAKAEHELGAGLSREDLVSYIEEKTGVDIDGLDDLTELEIRKVNLFTKDYKANLLAEQEKYKTPVVKEKPTTEEVETITLDNGVKIDKTVYENHLKIHQAYQEDIKVAVNSVAPTSLSIKIDNAGQEEVLTFEYEHDADDKKGMVSLASDLDQTVANLFRSEKGFDHQAFAKAVWRMNPENWEKEVGAIAHKVRAQAVEEIMKVGNNVNLDTTLIPGQTGKPGVKIVPIKELFNR
ncbi:hypothetical protein [Flavobacterium sp. FlaQc-50]|uniref:hypothetical protein n=1 Tax=unclassified Flavobacterium TaxID=196869 RepID=UPI003756DCA8